MSTSPGSSSTSRTSICALGVDRLGHAALSFIRMLLGLVVAVVLLPLPVGWRAGRVQRNTAPGVSRGVGVQPDPAAVVLDDLLAHRQADAGAAVGVPAVQPLEDHEDLVGVLRFDADAVVAAGELPQVGALVDGDAPMCTRGASGAAELHPVADQVLEQLDQQARVAVDRRQRVVADHGRRLRREPARAVVAPAPGPARGRPRRSRWPGPADPRERQQVVDELLHPLRAVDGELDVLVAPLVELSLVPPFDAAGRSSRPCAAAPAGRARRRRRTARARCSTGAGPRPAPRPRARAPRRLRRGHCSASAYSCTMREPHAVDLLGEHARSPAARRGPRPGGSRSPPSTRSTSPPSRASGCGHPAAQGDPGERHRRGQQQAEPSTERTNEQGDVPGAARDAVRARCGPDRCLEVGECRPDPRRTALALARSVRVCRMLPDAVARRRSPVRRPARPPGAAVRWRPPRPAGGQSAVEPRSSRRVTAARLPARRRRRAARKSGPAPVTKPRKPVSWSQ